ncbi:MAG: sel1 repeat family protein [Alphaproteobacteria bacterium]|nr:sel1 repeat family protein [Alphaproteobacteria bacterium]
MRSKLFFALLILIVLYSNARAQIDLGVEDISGSVVGYQDGTQDIDNKENSTIIDNTLNLFGKTNEEKDKKTITLDDIKAKADAGDVQSQLDLGYMFLYGENGANVDYKQAIYYYELAAQNKNAVALNNMGSLYFNGIGTEVNYPKAIKYFEEAAKFGSNDAALNLAVIYLGNDKKHRTTEEWNNIHDLLHQAQKTNYLAKYLYGYAYYLGFLVEKDYVKAFSLIKEAADNQYDEAQYILADMYITGTGTTKNYAQAVNYLRAATHQGHIGAMMKLAQILEEGKIYTQNIMNAHILYNIASVSGAEGAAEKRDEIEKLLKIENLLAAQASAENFKPEPSKNTNFVKQTFGNSLKAYIDTNIESANGIVENFN